MRDGFTLLELLVVVGIMGMLGVAATSGYSALQRGMTERGAVAVAASVLRTAQERAHVDRMPTAVYCYNRLLRQASGSDENGVVVGVMVAVRRSGRLSYVKGNLLYDEFADLDRTYDAVEDENDAKKGGGFRLFRFNGTESGGGRMEYSIVSDQIVRDTSSERVTLFSGAGRTGGRQVNLLSSAFLDLGTGRIKASDWNVGDGYGFVFNETQLPEGFIFGQSVPTSAGSISTPKVIVFDPDSDTEETVDVWRTRPGASGNPETVNKAGTASSDSKKAV